MKIINIYIYQTITPDIDKLNAIIAQIDQFYKININIVNISYSYPKLWNECIIKGYKCDYIFLFNTTNTFTYNNLNSLLELIDKYNFINPLFSNELMGFSPNFIHKIGLFDESLHTNFDIDITLRSKKYSPILTYLETRTIDLKLERTLDITKNIQNVILNIDKHFIKKWNINTNEFINNNNFNIEYLNNIAELITPPYISLYPLFDDHIIVNNDKPYLYLENEKSYRFYNISSGMYLTAINITPKNNRSIIMSDSGTPFKVSLCENYFIKLPFDIKNQNNTIGWHLYTVHNNDLLYSAGDNGIWATFKFEQKDGNKSIWYIKTYHNGYLYVNGNKEVKSNGSINNLAEWMLY